MTQSAAVLVQLLARDFVSVVAATAARVFLAGSAVDSSSLVLRITGASGATGSTESECDRLAVNSPKKGHVVGSFEIIPAHTNSAVSSLHTCKEMHVRDRSYHTWGPAQPFAFRCTIRQISAKAPGRHLMRHQSRVQ